MKTHKRPLSVPQFLPACNCAQTGCPSPRGLYSAKRRTDTAALKETFRFFWVGFYLVKGDELVLAPFQGPVACTRIKKGRGVCGKAWEKAETLVVPDVDAFPGHIACSSLSRSEIVVPLLRAEGEVWGVLDVDSESLNGFDETDARFLRELCSYL